MERKIAGIPMRRLWIHGKKMIQICRIGYIDIYSIERGLYGLHFSRG